MVPSKNCVHRNPFRFDTCLTVRDVYLKPVGYQRLFASVCLSENGNTFKRIARSARIFGVGTLGHRSGHFPLLLRKWKHIGCTSGSTAIESIIGGEPEGRKALPSYLETAFRRAVAGSYS